MSVTAALAAWAAGWDGEAPPTTRRYAREAFLDTLAVTIAGAGDETAARVRRSVAAWGGGRATIVGAREGASAPWAALCNGTAAHALDYDDNLDIAQTHASAVLMPALWALAQEHGKSPRAVLDAWIVGIEAQMLVALGVNRLHYDNGWHSTSTIGTIGAAAACGRLLGLDAERMLHAISLSVSMASGLKSQFGTPAKPFHSGMAAKNAVMAATLAAEGMRGCVEPLDGAFGFRQLYADGAQGWAAHVAAIGWPLAVETYGIDQKFYPTCMGAHRTLDAVIGLQRELGFAAADVAEIHTTIAWGSTKAMMYDDPQNEMQARFSMPYCVAVALLHGRPRLADFTLPAVRRAEVRALLPVTRMAAHPRANDDDPEQRVPALIRLLLKDGRAFDRAVKHAKGTRYAPLTEAELSEKVEDCVRGLVPGATYERLKQQLGALEEVASIDAILDGLRFDAGADRGERLLHRAY